MTPNLRLYNHSCGFFRLTATHFFLPQWNGMTILNFIFKCERNHLLFSLPIPLVRIWDVRPFASPERCVKIFQGHQHNFEKVSKLKMNELITLSFCLHILFSHRVCCGYNFNYNWVYLPLKTLYTCIHQLNVQGMLPFSIDCMTHTVVLHGEYHALVTFLQSSTNQP